MARQIHKLNDARVRAANKPGRMSDGGAFSESNKIKFQIVVLLVDYARTRINEWRIDYNENRPHSCSET